jgi:hypothetical protein
MVCSTHSKNRILLPNIHKTQPQRVCDPCSLVIQERNSLRLSESQRLSRPKTCPRPLSEEANKKTEISLPEDGEAEEEEEEEENVRETYMSRRFSMKALKWFSPVTISSSTDQLDKSTSVQATQAPAVSAPEPEPDPVPPPVLTDAMRREELLTKLLTQKLNLQFDDSSRPIPPSSFSSSEMRQLRHSTPAETSSWSAATSKQKIIPAFSIPITFMLTHDSIKSRKSIISSREGDGLTGMIELPERMSLPWRPDQNHPDDGGRGSMMIPSSRSLSSRSMTGFNQSEAGLLNMLTAVLKDDRELLMESDEDENDDDSSVEEEDEEVEVIEMNDGRRFDREDS